MLILLLIKCWIREVFFINIDSFISTKEEKDIWLAAKYIGFLASYTYLIDVAREEFSSFGDDQIKEIIRTPFEIERN